jgi:hypothetical protein
MAIGTPLILLDPFLRNGLGHDLGMLEHGVAPHQSKRYNNPQEGHTQVFQMDPDH